MRKYSETCLESEFRFGKLDGYRNILGLGLGLQPSMNEISTFRPFSNAM